jgi:putative membrane protein
MNLILKLLINAITVFVVAHFLPGISITDFGTALLVALTLGFINIFIKPIISILTLPLTILTLGLFSIVINALMLWLSAQFVSGFEISGFTAALLGSLMITLIVWILEKVINIK